MFLVLFGVGVRGGREEGEEAGVFVDGGGVFVVGAVSEGEDYGWGEAVGTVWDVGFGVYRLTGHDGCEGAFCQYCVVLVSACIGEKQWQ